MGSSNTARVPRLLLVTDRHATAGRSLTEVIAAALRGLDGGELEPEDVAVQLREKDLGGRALAELARPLRALTAAAGVALFVNDRVDVALALGADGVHLGGASLSAEAVARIAPGLAIGVSTHGTADVAAAASGRGPPTFALFGPVRETPSKRSYGAPLGVAALADAAQVGLPLVAIGGLVPDDVAALMQAGARGVACIRAVMAAVDPAAAVAAFCARLKTPRPPAPPDSSRNP